MTRHFHFKALAVRSLVSALAGGGVGVTMAVKGLGVMALVGQQAVTFIASFVLLWISCPWRPDFRISLSAVREILVFWRGYIGNSVIGILNSNCDTFLIALFFGTRDVGIYNVGKRVRLMLQLVTSRPLNGTISSTLAEIQDDPGRLQRGILRGLTIVCTICAPIFIGTSAVSYDAIIVGFGQKWIETTPVLQLLAISGFCMVLQLFNDNIFIIHKRQAWCMYVALMYFVLSVLAFCVCSKLQVSAFALPFVLPYICVIPFSFFLVSQLVNISLREWLSAMLPGISSAIAMWLAVKLLQHQLQDVSNLVRLVASCLAGGIFYVMALWVLWRKQAFMTLDIVRHILQRRS